jgi:hypothetical protein
MSQVSRWRLWQVRRQFRIWTQHWKLLIEARRCRQAAVAAAATLDRVAEAVRFLASNEADGPVCDRLHEIAKMAEDAADEAGRLM